MKAFASLITFIFSALLFTYPLSAQEANWLRYPAISPDGSTIAFNYKGNIYTVPSVGGSATPLTLGENYNYKATWSPDGSKIAFASDRHGNFDVFVVDAKGGAAQRLTHHSANDLPQCFSADGAQVFFTSGRMMTAQNAQFPYGRFNQLYAVSTSADRPVLALDMPLDAVSFNQDDSKMLYMDLKGYEDYWRKHHTSSIARDIWLYDTQTKKHQQLSTFNGEDRHPLFTDKDKSILYLSEASGTFNVWKMNATTPSEKIQLTNFDTHPVRFLSQSNTGILCFGYNGKVYTLSANTEPKAISIKIPYDQSETIQFEKMGTGASEMALSPNGKEIAFIIRGEVFVTGAESGLTKRITNTPEQERSVSFSPDGRKLLYAAERNGSWNLYESELAREEEPYFYAATTLSEKAILKSDAETFQPAYSPDGKEVAYLEERTTLKVLNLKNNESRTVVPAKYNYSYSDGDQYYQWSPDSKWFLLTYITNERWTDEMGLVNANGKEDVINLSQSGYSEGGPQWVLDGKAVLYTSDRQGFRSHGSWGAQVDAFTLFFDTEAYERFSLSKDEFAIVKEREKEAEKEKKEAEEKDKNKKSKKKEDEKDSATPLDFELNGIEDRTKRLTLSSSFISDMVLSPEGDKLYYLASRDNSYDLWELDTREKSTKTIGNFKGGGANMVMDEKGENLYVMVGGKINQVKTADGKTKGVSYQAEMNLNKAAERDYMFEHMWRQVLKKFYLEDLHGVAWDSLKANYQAFLPHINNNRDYAEMMSELLGELNGSHTGCRYSHSDAKGDKTAALGIFIDFELTGVGIKIEEILDKSPFSISHPEVKAGMLIEKIDGETIKAGQNFWPLLNHKAGKKILLSLYDPQSKKRMDVDIKAISLGQESNLLYERWVKQRRAETERLSDGKVGYVHVRGMNSNSYREVYSELLGRHAAKKAVVVDTRFNGGGWLHDDLATLLDGKQYAKFVPRGQYIGSEPMAKWQNPSVVLVGESNYSDAHGFPFAYRAMGVGELVGMPIPGTMTAVWWEQQIDQSLVFGIPQVGVQDMDGHYMENREMQPDHLVKNRPEDFINGKDPQLEKAVELMLKRVD